MRIRGWERDVGLGLVSEVGYVSTWACMEAGLRMEKETGWSARSL